MISRTWLKRVAENGPPAVMINFGDRSWPRDTVVWDSQAGAGLCVDYFVNQGLQRIGYVGSPNSSPGARLRWVGFSEAMTEHGLEPRTEDQFFTESWPPEVLLASIREQVHRRREDLPEALICDVEMKALATGRILGELGKSDVQLACADQLTPASSLTLPIPHVTYPAKQVGQYAVERLLRRIERPDEPFDHLRVAVTLQGVAVQTFA